jgi:hypothetical protein
VGNLFTKGASNAKTAKGAELGFENVILHLAPADLSGVMNACPFASAGCRAACLNTSGRGAMKPIQDARIAKTRLFHNDPEAFVARLGSEIVALVKRAGDKTVAVRLNGTSDILWENFPYAGYDNLMLAFPNVQFYDYTKIPNRRNIPANYDLTFSLSESNDRHAIAALARGYRVAVVMDGHADTWGGYPVVDGDTHDFRFLDPAGVIVALKAKGKARKDSTGFVRSATGGFNPNARLTLATLQGVA